MDAKSLKEILAATIKIVRAQQGRINSLAETQQDHYDSLYPEIQDGINESVRERARNTLLSGPPTDSLIQQLDAIAQLIENLA
jgi:hypothetical protein